MKERGSRGRGLGGAGALSLHRFSPVRHALGRVRSSPTLPAPPPLRACTCTHHQEFIEMAAENIRHLKVEAYMQPPTLLILDGPWDVVHKVEFDFSATMADVQLELAKWGIA
jgi:hypothetical protein